MDLNMGGDQGNREKNKIRMYNKKKVGTRNNELQKQRGLLSQAGGTFALLYERPSCPIGRRKLANRKRCNFPHKH